MSAERDASVLSRMGLGLWTVRSMAQWPRHAVGGFSELVDDALLAEELGFHSIWSAEHRMWYDGWCPSPLLALAHVAGATRRLRLGTAVLLASQHDPISLARTAATLDRVSGGRLDLGIGLGHRDVEFDALGLRRDRRGRMMDRALELMPRVWGGEYGDAPPIQAPGPALWMGGMAPRVLERAVAGNYNLLLPQTLSAGRIGALIEDIRARGWSATAGVMRDLWIEDDPARVEEMRRRLERGFTEEAGWWVLQGHPAFDAPELLARQLHRVSDAALIGSADDVAAGLRALLEAGVGFLCLRINIDIADHAELREQMHRVAGQLPPRLAGALVTSGARG
ncbi:MAG TPA: LLM class flavin-dependent oxidoreductase [Solirubrobacteraceae bacterium]|nr:LLM class flavin-dependent oxidoreductase [Solirubrobacteraceae bacterium]